MNDIDRGVPADKDLPLKDDIRLLGRILGDTLREQEGEDTFALIERIRQTAIRFRREGDAQARGELEGILAQLPPAETVSVVRAFTYFSQLANIAEDLHRNRRRRAHQVAGSPPQEGTIDLALARAADAAIPIAALAAFFRDALVSPVLTAHPTEVQRKSILDCHLEIARLLTERDRMQLSAEEHAASEEQLRCLVLTLWQTRILRELRLTVADEIENGLSYYRYTFLREVPRLYRAIEASLRARWPHESIEVAPILRLGAWIGGDRDGNPFVTESVTEHALIRQSSTALEFYMGEVHELGRELSQSTRMVSVSDELEALAQRSPDGSDHRRDEPYRRALIGVYARLVATSRALDHRLPQGQEAAPSAPYARAAEFVADLETIARSLRANRSARIAQGRLRELARCAGIRISSGAGGYASAQRRA
jgi:phosphoenolpyruvate carboxylase